MEWLLVLRELLISSGYERANLGGICWLERVGAWGIMVDNYS